MLWRCCARRVVCIYVRTTCTTPNFAFATSTNTADANCTSMLYSVSHLRRVLAFMMAVACDCTCIFFAGNSVFRGLYFLSENKTKVLYFPVKGTTRMTRFLSINVYKYSGAYPPAAASGGFAACQEVTARPKRWRQRWRT